MMDCSKFMEALNVAVPRFALAAILWLSLTSLVDAQTGAVIPAKPLSAPEALKDIQPAGQSCRRDDVVSNANKSSAVNPKESAPDMTCSITATELNLWLLAKEIVAIDTRSANEYAQYRIDGAVNLSAQDIRYKLQLIHKNIALIGTGKHERELFALCASLKAKGHKSVKVLQGGMLAWQLSGLQMLGRVPPIDSLQTLDPSQLLAETQFTANLIVVSSSRSDMVNQIKRAVTATSDDIEAVVTQIQQLDKQKPPEAMNAVVWIAPVNTKPDTIAQLQARLLAMPRPLPLLVYGERSGDFQKFMTQQQAMWSAQAKGPKQPACGV